MSNPDELIPSLQALNSALGRSSIDLLMQVEVPVSVSLGRTRMRMKDLLKLNRGSVVELDEFVGDEVEILVNKRVLAHGEVVAVDGNYGVRITRLAGQTPQAQATAAGTETAPDLGGKALG
jgi:flagellar motor switch protein FliN/FliY